MTAEQSIRVPQEFGDERRAGVPVFIQYLHHSGFLIDTGLRKLVFDWDGSEPAPELGESPACVFVSHGHEDHYSRKIFSLRDSSPQAVLLLSDDISPKKGTLQIGPCEKKQVFTPYPESRPEGVPLPPITVRTLPSTDEGAAFLVYADGVAIYFAGDMNWWYWEDEPDPWNPDMAQMYTERMDSLKGEKIDLAFLPADPRLGPEMVLGLDYFMGAVGAQMVFPMHFWDDFSIFDSIENDPRTEGYRQKIVRISQTGEWFSYLKEIPEK